jgi:hypothetical protein
LTTLEGVVGVAAGYGQKGALVQEALPRLAFRSRLIGPLPLSELGHPAVSSAIQRMAAASLSTSEPRGAPWSRIHADVGNGIRQERGRVACPARRAVVVRLADNLTRTAHGIRTLEMRIEMALQAGPAVIVRRANFPDAIGGRTRTAGVILPHRPSTRGESEREHSPDRKKETWAPSSRGSLVCRRDLFHGRGPKQDTCRA